MTAEERKASKTLVYQCLPSRYGFNPDHLRQADAIEVVIGQGAKPGGGGMLLGQKVSERVAAMRTLPAGVDQRSASRHPDWTGPDDLRIKIEELREATSWEKPVYVKLGATRVANDVKLAVAAGADVVVVDGMQGRYRRHADRFHRAHRHPDIARRPSGGRGAARDREAARGAAHRFRRHPLGRRCGQGASARRDGRLDRRGRHGRSRLQPVLLTGETARTTTPRPSTRLSGRHPGFCHHCHTGLCPVGVTTQDPDLESRLDPEVGARWVTNYLRAMTMELTALARACGKSNVHNLEPEDLVALTVEAAAMAKVPLAGTNWIPGEPPA